MKNEPLGLPKGSVRAIFILFFSITIFLFLFFKREIPEQLLDFWIALVSFYFGFRSNFNNGKKNG